MLRRLTVGLFALACAAAFAACSSSDSTTPSTGGVPGIGPNFVTNTLYLTNTTQGAVEIYSPNPAGSAAPQYAIAGTNTQLNGPQYDAFDSAGKLYVTNYNAGSGAASVTVYAQYATSNVLPVAPVSGFGITQPHGVAILPKAAGFIVANTDPGGPLVSELLIFTAPSGSGAALQNTIAGSLTNLNYPTGVAIGSSSTIFVANRAGSSVTAYALPSPAPSPSGTATPPAPTPTPSGSPSPTPTPAPNALNVAPIVTISGSATGLVAPTGIALDANDNIYVADPDNGVASIRIFAAGSNGNVAPTRVISGSSTLLSNPTDVKVDAAGNIYVADSGTNKLLIFGPGATGNVAPISAVGLPGGSVTGVALSP